MNGMTALERQPRLERETQELFSMLDKPWVL
jgi:hypothetical protein